MRSDAFGHFQKIFNFFERRTHHFVRKPFLFFGTYVFEEHFEFIFLKIFLIDCNFLSSPFKFAGKNFIIS